MSAALTRMRDTRVGESNVTLLETGINAGRRKVLADLQKEANRLARLSLAKCEQTRERIDRSRTRLAERDLS